MNKSIKKVFHTIYQEKSSGYLSYLNLMQENSIEFMLINLPLNYEVTNNPNDLDIVLDSENFIKAKELLKQKGFIKLDRFINTNQEAYMIYLKECNGFVRLHLHQNFAFYGQNILSYQELKKYSILNDGFYYPNIYFDKAILLFESFFRKKGHYYNRIKQLESSKETKEDIQLANTNSQKLYKTLFKMNKNSTITTTKIQVMTMLKHFKNLKVLIYIFKKIFLYLKTFIPMRKGKMIFLLGIDGSGKSTIGENVYKSIDAGGFLTRYTYWGLKVTLLQKFKNLFKKTKPQQETIEKSNNAHTLKIEGGIVEKLNKKSKVLGTVFYFCLSIVYIIDYWLLIFKDLKFISSENNYLIVDRSYYDKLSDTTISANKLFYYFLPKPDCIIRLNGDLNVLYERKKEFSVEDLKILNDRVDNIIRYSDNKDILHIEIDTTKMSIDNSINTIIEYLWENR